MLNSIILHGRLTKDTELKTTQSGKSIIHFDIAVNRYVKDKDHPECDYFRVCAFEKTAEFVSQYFIKGNQIIVEGSVRTGSYTDIEGVKRKSFDVLARQVHFAGGKKNEETEQNGNGNENENSNKIVAQTITADKCKQQVFNSEEFYDDLPF
jgi:single-strand DNA-binding protein